MRRLFKDHIQLKVERLPSTVLLPGDPARVNEIAGLLEDVQPCGENREYKTIIGSTDGVPVAVCSTGMGGPSTEIAVVELLYKGAKRFLRVGTSGALQPDIEPGDLVISTGCIRETGAPRSFVSDGYPALADHQMVMALVQACEELGYPYHVGIGVCVDSFYATKPHLFQDRDIPSQIAPRLVEYQKAGALHMEMEAATVMVLAQILGEASAAICTVGSNLVTLKAPTAPITSERAIRVVCRSVQIMNEWDSLCARHKKKYYYPSLERTVRQ